MKVLISYCILSLALAIGTTACAHSQVSKQTAIEVAGTAALIAGIVALAATQNCGNCNIGGTETAAATALPPR
jgi:hypothetical protein